MLQSHVQHGYALSCPVPCWHSAEGDGVRLLSDWRDKVCGVHVPKHRSQCGEVLHHSQRPVACLEHKGEKLYLKSE